MFFAFLRLHNGFAADLLNKGEPHIGDCRCSVHASFFLHLTDDVLQRFFFVLIELKMRKHHFVALRKFAGRKANGNSRIRCMVFNQMHNCVQASMYGSVVVLRITKIAAARFFLILRHMNGVADQLADALVLCCRNRYYRDSERFLHLVYADSSPVFAYLIHHI